MAKENFSREDARRPESGCILKIKTNGRSFRGLVSYQSERGANIGGTITQLPIFTNMLGRTPRELSREMAVIRRLRPGLNTAVGHLQICPSRALKTKEDWVEAVQIAFDAHGIHDAPFVCYLHSEGDGKTNHAHLHIAFSRIRFDGSVISDSGSYRKNEIAARRIEEKFQLGVIQERSREKRPNDSQKAFDSLRREDRLVGESKEKPSGGMSDKKSSKSKGPKKMATKENIEKMAAAVERAMQHATSESEFKESLERDLEKQGIARQVNFARRGAENEIYGFSLVSDLGFGGIAAIKGSELGRHLSWTKVAAHIAENQDRARRRCMALHQTEATADAIQDTARVLAAPTEGAGAVIALGLGAQSRAVVKATRPTPGAKPHLFVVKPQGLEIPGYLATRGECLDPAHDVHLWEYRRPGSDEPGSDEIVFSDDGESLQIHGDALSDPMAVDAFVLAGRARFGASLTLTQLPAKPPHFLAMIAASAAERGVEIVDGRTGLPIGAQQAHEGPVPAPDGAHSLDFLDVRPDTAPASPAPAAGEGSAPALAEQQQPRGESLVAPAHEHRARREAAARVLAMAGEQAKRASGSSGPRLGVLPRDPRKVKVEELHELLKEAESWVPVQEWAEATKERHRRDRLVLEGGGHHPTDLVFAAANLRGDPLAMAASKAQEQFLHVEACLALARREREERSSLQKALEAVSGRGKEREEEAVRLEGLERDARAEAARAREAFFAQEDAKQAVRSTSELASTYDAESRALNAVELLLGLLARFIKALTGMLKQAEARDAEQVHERERREDLQRHAEALAAGDPVAIERYERAQKELQERYEREQFGFERGRG